MSQDIEQDAIWQYWLEQQHDEESDNYWTSVSPQLSNQDDTNNLTQEHPNRITSSQPNSDQNTMSINNEQEPQQQNTEETESTIPNHHFQIEQPELDFKIDNNHRVFINLTQEIKKFGLNQHPKHYNSNNYSCLDSNGNGKYVDCTWFMQFLFTARAKDNAEREKWIIYLAHLLEMSIYQQTQQTQIIKPKPNNVISIEKIGSCAHCDSTEIFVSNKKRKKVAEMTTYYGNQLIKEYFYIFESMIHSLGENFFKLCGLFLRSKSLVQIELVLTGLCTKGSLNTNDDNYNKATMYHVKKFVDTLFEASGAIRNPRAFVYFKDCEYMSDNLLQKLRNFAGLKGLIPCENTVQRHRNMINDYITKRYSVQERDGFYICEWNNLVKDVLTIHKNECININKPYSISELVGKISIDSGAKTYFVGSVVFLNLVLSPQQRHSNLIFLMSNRNENLETFRSMATIVNPIDSIIFDNVEILLKLMLVNDLKALGYSSDLNDDGCFCPFCLCKKHERGKFIECQKRTLKLIFKFKVIVMICSLHMKMRIVGNLLSQYCKKTQLEDWDILQNKIQQLPFFTQFQFRQSEEDDKDDFKKPEMPYMNGNQCNSILENYQSLFADSPVDLLIWEITYVLIFNYVEGPLSNKGNEMVSNRIKFLTEWLKKLLLICYPGSKFAYYIHILIMHLEELIFEYGNLSQFQNEGSENIHAGHQLSMERCISDANIRTPEEQLLLQGLRRFYIPSQDNIKWIGKLVESKEEDDKYAKRLNREKRLIEKLENIPEKYEEYFAKLMPSTPLSQNQPTVNKQRTIR